MKRAKFLLLDFNPESSIGELLHEALESTLSPEIQLQRESFRICYPAPHGIDITSITPCSDADVIFLVLSQGLLKRVDELFSSIRGKPSKPLFIVAIDMDKPEQILSFPKLGVIDFITPPFKPIDILMRVWRLLEQNCDLKTLTQKIKEKLGLKQLIGENSMFLSQVRRIPLLSQCDARIIISGETGTGKELFARAIHYLSPRSSKPFIPVNCGAIPTELIENELFGHERGAFTGASTFQPGLINEAEGGTLFLDEIDCLPLIAQVKLLRFLQEKEYRPLGSTKIEKADVRVIAATNVDLEVAVKEGKFRQDLYYRLNVMPLTLPSLRERPDDIPLLASHFLAKYAAQFNKVVTGFSPDALQKLLLYSWPGNVRELEHIIERAVLLCRRVIIQSDDIFLPSLEATIGQESFGEAKARVIEQFERTYIQVLLLTYQGNVSKAAHAAKKNRRAFTKLIRKYRINVQGFRSNTL